MGIAVLTDTCRLQEVRRSERRIRLVLQSSRQ